MPHGSALSSCSEARLLGSRFLLDTDLSPPAAPRSDIFLDHISVSRGTPHYPSPEGTVVRDVGSLNGTYVNKTSSTNPYCATAVRSDGNFRPGLFREQSGSD